MFFMRVFVCLAYLFFTGCLQTRLPEGVVATVNGEPIYLRTVQALLDGQISGIALETPSLKAMKSRYGEALGILVVNALVRQELTRRKSTVNDEDMAKALTKIRMDYDQEDFVRILAEESLNETEWQNLLRDHLSVQRLEENILLPDIKIELSAVRAYYNEHAKEFNLPETLNVCFAVAERKEELETYRNAFYGTAPELPHTVVAQCQNILPQDVPPEWKKNLSVLVERSCAIPVAQRNMWETLCLERRRPAGAVNMSEAYALIERQLLKNEKENAFERWIEASLAAADIRVSPHIKDDLLSPQRVEPVLAAKPLPFEDEKENREFEPIANPLQLR